MASAVDICNLALARLGDEATVSAISPADGSVQAMHCARFYPIARDMMMEAHPWKFAFRRAAIATTTDKARGWAFAYAMPSGCLKVLAIKHSEDYALTEGAEYEIGANDSGTMLIYTNQEDANLEYIALTTDTSKFTPLFVDALSWLLASYLAGPLLKGDVGMNAGRNAFANFRVAFSMAANSDADQRNVTPTHTPDWIGARGSSALFMADGKVTY